MVFNEHAPLDEKTKFFFKIFDKDGDGKITKNDMEETLAIVMPHETEERIKNNVSKIFEELDVSIDEGIVLDEFSTAVGSLVHQRCTIFF
jgi:Ca2+-binding EF-hand superfamily protein